MPQFGEERGDGKSYGGDNLPKGGGGGQNEVSCSGGRQDDQCRFGRRRHQDPSLQRCTTPGAADEIGKHTSELQSLMRISYAVFCLKTQKQRPKYQQILTTMSQHTDNKQTLN